MVSFLLGYLEPFPYETVFVMNIGLRITITKTCLYNFDPFKPHFYIVKWGLQGYTLFFFLL